MKRNGDTPSIPDIATVEAERVMTPEELEAVRDEPDDEQAEELLKARNEGFGQLVGWGAEFVIRRVPGEGKTRFLIILGLSVAGGELIRRFKQRRAQREK